MTVENQQFAITFTAKEDLSGSQYKAVALDDGKVANNGEEACGILKNKPESGEAGRLAHSGDIKFRAGGAIGAGARVTVATSGWITTASSGDHVIGRCGETAVTSGSVGRGLFNFSNPIYAFSSSFA